MIIIMNVNFKRIAMLDPVFRRTILAIALLWVKVVVFSHIFIVRRIYINKIYDANIDIFNLEGGVRWIKLQSWQQ